MDKNTPLYDTSLSVQERAKWIVSQMTLEEKLGCFTFRIANERLGITASACGGEGAHGVQARAGQREAYPPTPTTSFTQPIGRHFRRSESRRPRAHDLVQERRGSSAAGRL